MNQERTIDDFDIILNVLAGDRNAFAELIRKYEGKVRGYCRTTFRNSAQADDAAQEIFIKAYQALSRFRGDAAFSTWIYRIMVNHCSDILRKMGRQRAESWDELLEKEGDRIENLFSVPPETGASTERAELIAKLLAHLPEKLKAVIILREIQGLSYDELAKALNISLDAVKSRLKRARRELEIKARHFLAAKVV